MQRHMHLCIYIHAYNFISFPTILHTQNVRMKWKCIEPSKQSLTTLQRTRVHLVVVEVLQLKKLYLCIVAFTVLFWKFTYTFIFHLTELKY